MNSIAPPRPDEDGCEEFEDLVGQVTARLAGASPRGMSALMRGARVVAWFDGRDHVLPEDVHAVLPATLGHRVFFTPVYELRRAEIGPQLIGQIMDKVASP